jgi:hypothetical protein
VTDVDGAHGEWQPDVSLTDDEYAHAVIMSGPPHGVTRGGAARTESDVPLSSRFHGVPTP